MERGGLSGMNTAGLSVQKVGYTMDTRKNILIAVDRSDASLRAVAYVAAMIGQSGFRIELFHVLPPLPPEILEMAWPDAPELVEKAKAEFRAARTRWIAKAEQAAQPLFDRAKARLSEGGVPEEAIRTRAFVSSDVREVAADILEAARANHCGTVVVGRETFSGFEKMFHPHVGDQLVPQGQGLTFWIVE